MTAAHRLVRASVSEVGTGPEQSARITGIGTAFPPTRNQDDLWEGYFGSRLGYDRWARRLFLSAGVRQRHPAVDPTVEDVASWSTGARMRRYVVEALPLGRAAAAAALSKAGRAAGEVGLLVTTSCTGYATPGVDVHLVQELQLAPDTDRVLLGHMGCHAAIPGLGVARDYVVSRGRPALLLCIEVCSLHVQALSGRSDQVVTHALFSDAAAAVVVEPLGKEDTGRPSRSGPAWEVVDVSSRTDPASAQHLTWDVTDLGFRMGLSRRVPDLLARQVRPLVENLLSRNGMTPEEVTAWAVHPGGPRVLDVVAGELGLGEGALAASRQVLAEHGNCSSATVLVVLEELLERGLPPERSDVVALAFGPGLTACAALLRKPPRPPAFGSIEV